MSEEQLLITLGVQDKGSTTQIKALNQQLKYLDREFKISSQNCKNFENTAEGLRTKINYLGNKIEATKAKLQAYKNQMQQAQQGVAKKREELERLNQAEGDNSAAISKCEKQLERYQQQVLNAGRNINLTEAELRNLENTLQETNNKLNSQALENYKQKMSDLGDKVKSTGDKIKSFGEGMDKAGTTLMKLSSPIVGLSVAATKAAIDFESAFTGVIKTVDGTDAELEKLKNGILEMSKTMPESASDIAKVAESAGQLGIKTKNIEDFTKVMVMLGDSTNLSSEEAATSLARLANITGMSQDKFSNLGSSIVACGNNFATTESEITNMAMRLAGAGSQIGLTEADIIGLSTALSSVGIEAEAGKHYCPIA